MTKKNYVLTDILAGLKERHRDIFFDYHEFGDKDESGNVIEDDDNPGTYQQSIEKLCMAAEQAEELLSTLLSRPDLLAELSITEKSADSSRLSRSVKTAFEITPAPWTVESHRDTEGAYIINQAAYEQSSWVSEGYEISNEEGARRAGLADIRDANNARLLGFAPTLLGAVIGMLFNPVMGRRIALNLFETIKSAICFDNAPEGLITSRRMRAEFMLAQYCFIKGESFDEYETEIEITDMVTDLFHVAHREGLAPEAIVRMALGHFEEESQTEGE